MTAAVAEQLVRELLADLPARRQHSLAVGARVVQMCGLLHPEMEEALIPAGYLHDIGYATDIRVTGLHQIDGARWVANHFPHADLTARLIAHHSLAVHEASERHLLVDLLDEFPSLTSNAEDEALSILTYADMTTSPHGTPISVDERFRDIYSRYSTSGIVPRAMRKAEPGVRATVRVVQERMESRASA